METSGELLLGTWSLIFFVSLIENLMKHKRAEY